MQKDKNKLEIQVEKLTSRLQGVLKKIKVCKINKYNPKGIEKIFETKVKY